MADLDRLLLDARDAATGLLDAGPLDEALAVLRAPAELLVVGRRGAGKSALVSWCSGQRQPMGLGRTTQATARIPTPHVTWIDTPGFDDPDDAVVRLGPLAEAADGVVWITDGLQPWTQGERRVFDHLADPALPVILVVSRADLVPPEEHAETAARLRALTGLEPRWLDLRAAVRGDAIAAPPPSLPHPSPRRRERIRALVAGLRAPEPPQPAAVRETFRTGVRAAVAGLLDDLAARRLRDLEAVGEALARAHDRLVATLAATVPVPLPDLPRPPAPERTHGGPKAALLHAAAAWSAEGELALADRWPEATDLVELGRRSEALSRALDAVRANL